MMIRFVRIILGFVAAAAAVGWVQRALDLHDVAGGLGNAAFILVALLLGSLADRDFFWNV
jgi:hypothetical protein